MPPPRLVSSRFALLAVPLAFLWWSAGSAQQPLQLRADTEADVAARETFVRVCVKCHTAERVVSQGRTRDGWEEVMISMRTARAATFTDEEFDVILAYLARYYGPGAGAPANAAPPLPGAPGAAAGGQASPGRASGPAGRGPRAHVGAADRHRVDPAAAERGRKTYAAECVTCHGPSARGGDNPATNLIRSSLVLRDRYGSAIGPLLRNGHPTQTGTPSATFTDAQIADLSHFIWDRINDTLQGSPAYEPKDILTGDPAAGRAYFNGEGGCTACHSADGDLAKYGSRFNPVDIQQRFVFPAANAGRGRGSRKPVTVTVTAPGTSPVTGVLVSLDDFHVALRDAGGAYRSWTRTPQLQVQKTDPYAAHVELLERLTDKAMHDVVAYLETLK